MNKNIIYILMLLVLVVGVSATTTTLTDDSLTMDYHDQVINQFCISQSGVPLQTQIVIDPVCKDLNGLLGCQADDEINPVGFSVLTTQIVTDENGCANITVQTNLAPEDAGVFYYTVNGVVGDAKIGSETGTVLVPEFGVLGAAAVLGLVGLYIYKKRD